MFPLCLPFVTPGTEMSPGKETHACTHTHTVGAADTHGGRSAEATELTRESKWRQRNARGKQKEEKETRETRRRRRRCRELRK